VTQSYVDDTVRQMLEFSGRCHKFKFNAVILLRDACDEKAEFTWKICAI
jgi:hypothetical protein